MDWTQTLTIIISLIGLHLVTFFYLMSRIDGKFSQLDGKFSQLDGKFAQIDRKFDDLKKEIQKNREDILWIKWRMDPNEHLNWKSVEEPIEKEK